MKDQETQTVNPGALKRWKSSGKIEKEVMGLYESCEDGSMKIDRFGDTSLEAKVMEELYDFEKCGGCEGGGRRVEEGRDAGVDKYLGMYNREVVRQLEMWAKVQLEEIVIFIPEVEVDESPETNTADVVRGRTDRDLDILCSSLEMVAARLRAHPGSSPPPLPPHGGDLSALRLSL